MSLLGIGALLAGTAALGGIGTSLGLGLSAQAQSEKAAEMQTREAARQFDENLAWQREQYRGTQKWLENLSNTAHQREVADLLAAGLNPILSVGGNGASTPGMSSPSSVGSTALATTPDYVGAAEVAAHGINSAVSNLHSAVDTYSNASLREAKAAEALARASQVSTLTQPMRDNLEKQSAAFSASAVDSLSRARATDSLTPLQMKNMEANTSKAIVSASGQALDNRWKTKLYENQLLNSAASRRFQLGLLKTRQVDSAMGVFNGVRKALTPWRFETESSNGSNWIPDKYLFPND